jgi:hypothetical protein
MRTHTELPWQLNDRGDAVYGPEPDEWCLASMVYYEKGGVGAVPDEEQRANAALIVRAVNNFGNLLLALKDVAAACEGRSIVPAAYLLGTVLAAIEKAEAAEKP